VFTPYVVIVRRPPLQFSGSGVLVEHGKTARRHPGPKRPDGMKALTAARPLRWVQDRGRKFCLHDPEQRLYATLEFETTTGSLATGEAAKGRWTFKRVGFFRPCISVRPLGLETDVALFREGRVHFAGGRAFLWKPTRLGGKEMGFEDQKGRRLLRLKPRFGLRKYEADLQIEPASTEGMELAILVLLSWHISLLHQKDVEAGWAAAVLMMMSG
jgi:hypothetical protein